MVEFSWKSRSTSTSTLLAVMHQVIPPTTCSGHTHEAVWDMTLGCTHEGRLEHDAVCGAHLVERGEALDARAEVAGGQQQVGRLLQLNRLLLIVPHVKLCNKTTHRVKRERERDGW